MRDWQKRVVVERDELNRRVELLSNFIDGEKYKTLDDIEGKTPLLAQLGIMCVYENILNERIDGFET